MTVILGYTDGKHTWLAGDSYCSASDTAVSTCAEPKVLRIKPRVGFGACGTIAYGYATQQALTGYLAKAKNLSNRNALATHMRNALGELSAETLAVSESVLAVPGHVYHLDSEFGLWEPRGGRVAIGAGAEIARGAMQVVSWDDPAETLLEVIKATGELSPYVLPPYQVIKI